jgi:hypothetical protein
MLISFDEEKNVGFAKALQLCLTEVTHECRQATIRAQGSVV